jgi:type II secretory pathway component PulF
MYWEYRAYDANQQVFSGVIKGRNLPTIALELRQKGLQIITVTRIDQKSYTRQNRLQQLQKRFNNGEIHEKPTETYEKPTEIHKKSILKTLLNIFRGRN